LQNGRFQKSFSSPSSKETGGTFSSVSVLQDGENETSHENVYGKPFSFYRKITGTLKCRYDGNKKENAVEKMSEEKFWLTMFISLSIIIGTTVCIGMNIYNNRCQLFINGGYTRTTLQGLNGSEWILVKPEISSEREGQPGDAR